MLKDTIKYYASIAPYIPAHVVIVSLDSAYNAQQAVVRKVEDIKLDRKHRRLTWYKNQQKLRKAAK